MASIVYITDWQMIEFHRLNGDKTMNFWRPSSSRKISDLHPGDLLFFLAKGTERGITREKGIVGYGKYQETKNMSLKNMWKTYTTANGYPTEQMFFEAVSKVSKTKEPPSVISGLYLINCVYFQAPIYLSEIGVEVSNMIESYFYLDKDDRAATTKILNKAKDVGLDTWMAMMNNFDENDTPLEDDTYRHIVSEVLDECEVIYDEKESKKASKISKQMYLSLKNDGIDVEIVKGFEENLVSVEDKKIEVFLPLIANSKNINKKIQFMIGRATVIKGLLKQKIPNKNIEVTLIIESLLKQTYQQMLKLSNTSYLYLDKQIENIEQF